MTGEVREPEIVDQKKQLATVRDLLFRMKDQLAMAVPKHMKVERLMRVALTSIQKNPALLDCAPVTLIGAIVQCAQLGLEPDDGTGKAYLVPFNNSFKKRKDVQFIAGYKGLIQLARNSGEISSVEAHAVHEKDKFDYSFGTSKQVVHVPFRGGNPGNFVAAYAIAHFKDGGTQFDVMEKWEVDRIRGRSKAGQSGPWVTDYDEMGKKTVIRRLSKTLPASAELHMAVTLDEKAELSIPQDLGILIDKSEVGSPQPEALPTIEQPRAAAQEQPTLPPPTGKLTQPQFEALAKMAVRYGLTVDALQVHLQEHWKVKNMADVPVAAFQEAYIWIENTGKKPLK